MKKLILLTIFSLFLSTYSFARGRIPVCMPCEKLEEVKNLPDDESLLESGEYLNLGYLYDEYGAVFVPAWNTKGRYVLINEAKTIYYDLTDEQLANYAKTYDVDTSGNPLSFWKKIGGKLIYLVLIGFAILSKLGKDPDEEEEPENTSTES